MSKDHQTLLLAGDLTIRSSAQTKQLIEAALAGAAAEQSMLSIDIGDGHAADLTLPQLLISAKRTAERANMALRLTHPARGSLLSVLERSGIVGPGCRDNDFWLHEGVTQ